MKDKIRKVIREQIKKLKEYGNLNSPRHRSRARDFSASSPQSSEPNQVLQVTSENGRVVLITDPKDIENFLAGEEVYGEDNDGGLIGVSINSALDHQMTEGMSDEEWADAKEAERLSNHPEKDKINKIKQMMDKEEDDKEQAEYDKGWYGESLKEIAAKLGYLESMDNHPGSQNIDPEYRQDPQGLDKIEKGVTAITGGGRHHASVSDRGDSIRVSFRYARGEFAPEEWDKILKYLTGMVFEIKDESNSYEANYDREEPPEWVPTIHLQK